MSDDGWQHPVFPNMLSWYKAVGQFTDPSNNNFGKVTPQTPYVGMLAYADGVAWNPGSGAGYYRWSGSAWVHVG